MLVLLLLPFGLDARDFSYQGVNYTVLDEYQGTCTTKAGHVVKGGGSTVSGEISLPSVVYDGDKAYTLTEIADYSFYENEELTGMNIPNTVKTIGERAFYGCENMSVLEIPASVTSIRGYAFAACKKLTHVKLPAGLTAISECLFWLCTNLQTVEIPSSVTSIGSEAFYYCEKLESIEIPSSVMSIGESAFERCGGLKELELPSSVSSIGAGGFKYCKSLQRIKLPEELTTISDNLFEDCINLTNIELPSSVTTVGDNVFEGCSALKSLKLYCKLSDYSWLKTAPAGCWVYCHSSELYRIKNVHCNTIAFTQPCLISIVENYYCGVKFKLVSRPDTQEPIDLNALNVKICLTQGYEVTVPNTTFTNLELGKEYFVKNLEMGTSYELNMTWEAENGEELIYEKFYTSRPSKDDINCLLSSTQTTMTIKSISVPSDETLSPSAISYRLKGTYSWTPYEGDNVVLTDLNPSTMYTIEALAEYGSYQIRNEFSHRTSSIGIYRDDMKYSNLTPTTVTLSLKMYPGDAKIVERWWTIGDRDIPGHKVTVTGLKPGTKYQCYYKVKTDKGYVASNSIYVTTPSMSLEMLQPRGVSATSAIVAANTNISDQEPNVGFQWKKYDAPSSLKPNEGYAAIYDGTLEGNIKNLQTDKYYQVRAFYKDYWGDYHTSDWVTFDPSDFSYFEPTVHTYPIENAGSDNVTLRGYALPGTEDVVRQGFQYWIRPADHNAMSREVSAGEIQTIEASGQIMSAVIENLQPGTTYVFRAFAETASGYSYGEEQTFTTEEQTGIDNVYIDDNEPEIVGYYDISGRKSSEPQRGLNIVVYSDGTTRKMVLK